MIALIVEAADLYDGLGGDPFCTDVGLVGDRIALIGDLSERDAHERVDGRGLALAPGFIDVHSHSDELWLANPRCDGKIVQGVTTEIGGNCGTSIAPLAGLALERKAEDLRPLGLEPAWSDFAGFFELVERSGVALNVASLAGLGTTRRCVRGDRAGRLDEAELQAETALVRSAVEQGAVGISSGLIYTPSRYAGPDELVACARAAVAGGAGRYVTHLLSLIHI